MRGSCFSKFRTGGWGQHSQRLAQLLESSSRKNKGRIKPQGLNWSSKPCSTSSPGIPGTFSIILLPDAVCQTKINPKQHSRKHTRSQKGNQRASGMQNAADQLRKMDVIKIYSGDTGKGMYTFDGLPANICPLRPAQFFQSLNMR
jgi:hypothetical protein